MLDEWYTKMPNLKIKNINKVVPFMFMVHIFIGNNGFKSTFNFAFSGRKAGKGCYLYQPGVRAKNLNPGAKEIMERFKIPSNPET